MAISGPNQETAAQRCQTGNRLADEAECFTGMKPVGPGPEFPSRAIAGIAFPFDDFGGGAVERQLRSRERMGWMSLLNRDTHLAVAARRAAGLPLWPSRASYCWARASKTSKVAAGLLDRSSASPGASRAPGGWALAVSLAVRFLPAGTVGHWPQGKT